MNHRTRFPFTFLAILALGAALAPPAPAAEVTMAWHDAQAGVKYRLECAKQATPEAWTVAASDIPQRTGPPPQGEAVDYQEFTVKNFAPGRYFFRCFVTVDGLESDASEVVQADVRPGPARTLIKIAMQSSTDLTEWKEIAAVTEDAGKGAFYRTQITILPQ